MTAERRGRSETPRASLLVMEITIGNSGRLRVSGLWIDDLQSCRGETDSIAYTLNSCADVTGIQVQLGIERYNNGPISVSDEGAMIFEYWRNGTAPHGAADRVRVLELSL